ncbi:MAG TPA: hypothetical protein VG711_11175, partial [Phycisphaerales bacterium]|nr:hypothetical protein [Phycisphaerales bacterium]
LPLVCYNDLCGQPMPKIRPRLGRSVGILAKDLHAFRFNRRMGTITWFNWLKSWARTRDLYFAWDDLQPFRGYVHTLLDHWKKGIYRDTSWMPTKESWELGLYRGNSQPKLSMPETHVLTTPPMPTSPVASISTSH